jgi:DNA-binding NtrC family response regulator
MKPLSVLVADDQAPIRNLITDGLGKAGHRVVTADNGDDAIKRAKEQPFDLLITDIVMPDADGLDVIRACKKAQPEIRVLAISGGGKYMESADCLKIAEGLGAHAAVMKPFTWEQLVLGIRQALPKPSRNTGANSRI